MVSFVKRRDAGHQPAAAPYTADRPTARPATPAREGNVVARRRREANAVERDGTQQSARRAAVERLNTAPPERVHQHLPNTTLALAAQHAARQI